MPSRWSLFGSGLVVFMTWYLIAYLITSTTFDGLPIGFAFGLSASFGGLIVGAGIGVAAHAIDLNSVHRDVRAGDARDGARVSLGKLPPIVPKVYKMEDVIDQTETEQAAGPVSESLPPTDPDPAPERAGPTVPDTVVVGVDVMPVEAMAETWAIPVPDRLAAECARFVSDHGVVAVMRGEVGDAGVGAIDRVASPAEFCEFMALVSVLEGEGVDVSRVTVSAGQDGLPAAVTFPVASDNNGELQ